MKPQRKKRLADQLRGPQAELGPAYNSEGIARPGREPKGRKPNDPPVPLVSRRRRRAPGARKLP